MFDDCKSYDDDATAVLDATPALENITCTLHRGVAHRPHSSSFLGLPNRILNINPKKELLWIPALKLLLLGGAALLACAEGDERLSDSRGHVLYFSFEVWGLGVWVSGLVLSVCTQCRPLKLPLLRDIHEAARGISQGNYVGLSILVTRMHYL